MSPGGTVGMLILAALFPLIAVLVWIWITKKRKQTRGRVLTIRGLTVSLALGLLAALWCLNFVLLPFELLGKDVTELDGGTRFVVGLLRSVQVFGADEGFHDMAEAGRALFKSLEWDLGIAWAMLYIYMGVLYVGAPIVGGFGLLEVMAGIFPGFQHWIYGFFYKREKYYFSRLTDASLALATSISQVKYGVGTKPVLIFTEVAEDDPNAAEAKALGAVCLKKALHQIGISRWGNRKFFLMNREEADDGAVLQQLIELADAENCQCLEGAEVFIFVESDAYVQAEKNLRKQLEAQMQGKKLPMILPVRCDFNLVGNLLADVPLFESLVGKEPASGETRQLTMTILGGGALAREMFLTAYWIGQILDHRLRIRVCAEGSEAEFWQQMDRVNPEIRRTVTPQDPILEIRPNGEKAEVYAQVEYIQCDMVRPAEFPDTDYFFIALESDQDNIAMADTVRRYMGEAHIAAGDGSRTVITYVVRDQQLADTLNQEKKFAYAGQSPDVYMQAVGSLREIYSIRNVFMLNHDRYAKASFDAFEALQNRENREKQEEDRRSDEYKYWASLARSLHLIYKVYSAGWLSASLFEEGDEEQILQRRKQECQRAREIFYGNFPADFKPDPEAHVQLLHRLSWLEHRRWNAFTRVKGYRQTNLYHKYGAQTRSHKQMELKLHPCLVECDQRGIRSTVRVDGKVDKDTMPLHELRDDYDYLDILTYECRIYKKRPSDFKYYDYPFESVKGEG